MFLGFNQAGSSLLPAAIAELVTKKHRGYVLSAVNVLALVWNVAGSLIAHALVANTAPGWRSVYWMVLVMNLAGVIMSYLTYFPDKPLATRGSAASELVRTFDYIGLLGIVVSF